MIEVAKQPFISRKKGSGTVVAAKTGALCTNHGYCIKTRDKPATAHKTEIVFGAMNHPDQCLTISMMLYVRPGSISCSYKYTK